MVGVQQHDLLLILETRQKINSPTPLSIKLSLAGTPGCARGVPYIILFINTDVKKSPLPPPFLIFTYEYDYSGTNTMSNKGPGQETDHFLDLM